MNKLLQRSIKAFTTAPKLSDWLDASVLLLLYGLLYLPIGFQLGFLHITGNYSGATIAAVILKAFIMPALIEEFVFRVLLNPHPAEAVRPIVWKVAAIGSWALFVVYHLNPFAPKFFQAPAFLLGAGLLGIVCTVAYRKSGSIWPPLVIHWAIVVNWLLVLGGLERFSH